MSDNEVFEKELRLILGEGLGLEVSDPNLFETPKRILRMWNSMFVNNNVEFEGATVFPNEKGYDQLVIKKNIPVASMCSHHFMPFFGVAHFGYLPDKSFVGLSKITRIAKHYCKRPQIQEALTHEIITKFDDLVNPKWSMLILKCKHTCSSIRGAESGDAEMITSALGKNDRGNKDLKTEFLQLLMI